MNPYYKKLKDDHGIAPHISRLAKDMDIISQNEALVTKYPYLYYYRTIYKECLTSFYATSYSVAMASKDNYREFALMTVNIMAYINLMRKWLENPFDIEIMSEPDIDRFMFSFGITFFRDLPFKYKTLIARNLNKLIASKGTDRVIVDILEIFNFSGIDIYKYYLAKEATDQPAGSKSSNWLINKNLDVYFLSHTIKIPSLQIAMKNNEYKKTRYEKMVSRDPYWQIEKHEIAAMDFDFVETKYFSIESGFDFTTELLNSSLMFNLIRKIRSDYKNKEFLSITSRSLPGDGIATLEDILVTIQVLTCDLYNVPDTIEYSLEATANVNSFAKKDLVPAINTQLFIDHPDVLSNPSEIALENLDTVPRFDRYTTSGVFKKNSLVKDKLFHLMKREVDYKKYKTLKSAYNSKFYQKLNYDLFRPYASFSSYLEASSPDLYSMIEESRNTLITSEKQALIKEQVTLLTNIANSIIDSFFFFFDTTSNDLNEMLKLWKTIGAVPQKENESIWNRFKSSLDTFFEAKKVVFEKMKEDQDVNYNKKVEICVKAEAISERNDWRNATQELLQLQKEWKDIGYVQKKLADKLWARFRAACDKFFERKSTFFQSNRESEVENLAKKEALITAVKEFQFGQNKEENLNAIKDFQRQWSEIG
jgi:hypothetical protein